MIKKKIILHVGTHKTGTTAIQSMLSINSEYLKNNWVLYPSAGRFGRFGGHHNIAAQLNNDKKIFKNKFGTLENLCAEIKKTNFSTVIISSESFQCLYSKPDKLRILNNCFEECGYSTEVIIFFRDQISYMEKLYRELLKYGMDIAFEEYAEEILNSGKFIYNHAEDSEIFSFTYEDIIKGFAEVFGKKNIRCVQYVYPVEPVFLKSIGLYDLYPNLKPVNRTDLINKTLPLIKSVALEYYNRTVSTKGIPDKLKQIGRNHIVSWQVDTSVEYPVIPYLYRIKTELFIKKFERLNINLNNNYGLELTTQHYEYGGYSKIPQINKYNSNNDNSVSVEMLINKALKISELSLTAAKALRKFHKLSNHFKK